MRRTIIFQNGDIYHVYNKSIYAYQIFTSDEEYQRILSLIRYYQFSRPQSYSLYLRNPRDNLKTIPTKRVNILAWCVMRTHFHFILEQLTDQGIEHFMADIQNAYTQFFNRRHNRRGPLWQNRFQSGSALRNEAILLEKICYVHSNPVKDLRIHADDWPHSSYHEYIDETPDPPGLTQWEHRIALRGQNYKNMFDAYLTFTLPESVMRRYSPGV